jgi:succinylglutamate desuccinylase
MPNDFAKLKEILNTASAPRATLKIFKDGHVVSEAEALELEQEVQAREEALAASLSFDEIISALVDEDCLDIAKKLHEILLEN